MKKSQLIIENEDLKSENRYLATQVSSLKQDKIELQQQSRQKMNVFNYIRDW